MGAVVAMHREPDSDISDDLFAEFWLMYPKHEAKLNARRAWMRLNKSEKVAALSALVNWRKAWMRREQQYTPHAATWLNNERWEDELPAEYTHVPRAATVLPEMPRKSGEIPAHVLAQIAKLKGR